MRKPIIPRGAVAWARCACKPDDADSLLHCDGKLAAQQQHLRDPQEGRSIPYCTACDRLRPLPLCIALCAGTNRLSASRRSAIMAVAQEGLLAMLQPSPAMYVVSPATASSSGQSSAAASPLFSPPGLYWDSTGSRGGDLLANPDHTLGVTDGAAKNDVSLNMHWAAPVPAPNRLYTMDALRGDRNGVALLQSRAASAVAAATGLPDSYEQQQAFFHGRSGKLVLLPEISSSASAAASAPPSWQRRSFYSSLDDGPTTSTFQPNAWRQGSLSRGGAGPGPASGPASDPWPSVPLTGPDPGHSEQPAFNSFADTERRFGGRSTDIAESLFQRKFPS
jgi:hypothetical protein